MSEFQPLLSTAGDESNWTEALSAQDSLEVSSEPDSPGVPPAVMLWRAGLGPPAPHRSPASETLGSTEEDKEESPLKKKNP